MLSRDCRGNGGDNFTGGASAGRIKQNLGTRGNVTHRKRGAQRVF